MPDFAQPMLLLLLRCFFFTGPVYAQGTSDLKSADSAAIHKLTFADLQGLIPEYMEIHDAKTWGTVDDVVIAGVPYTLVFVRRDDGVETWEEMKEFLPEKISEGVQDRELTDEQILAYVQAITEAASRNFEILSANALEENKEALVAANPDVDDDRLYSLMLENFARNGNNSFMPDAQKARNQYEALLILRGAFELYIARIKGKV